MCCLGVELYYELTIDEFVFIVDQCFFPTI